MALRKLLPTKTIYGYVRTSSAEQNPEPQVWRIHEWVRENFGDEVYRTVTFDRAEFVTVDTPNIITTYKERDGLAQVLDRLQPHDVLVTPTVERLGRDMRHVAELMDSLKEKQVIVIYIDEPGVLSTPATSSGSYPMDRSTEDDSTHELVSTLVSDLLRRVAAYEAEVAKIPKRSTRGVEEAKARGAYKKPKSLTAEDIAEARRLLAEGLSKPEVARRIGTSRSTLIRYLKGTVVPDK
jgi:DNA invertase Pin-like site-specific DNA recombinase